MKIDQSKIRDEAGKIDLDWQNFLTPDELDRMARQTGFTRRNSKNNKISGAVFMDLIVMNANILSGQSLVDLCIDFNENNNKTIAPQSLNERFNAAAVTFLKMILHRVIKSQLQQKNMFSTTAFNRVLIKDSTSFQISNNLAQQYPGSGGDGSKASMRVQFEYDLLAGEVTDLSLHAFNDQDATNSEITLDKIQSGDLIIRDLAYMWKDVLKGINQREATYLCRLGQGVSVYEQRVTGYEELSFKRLYKYMQENGLSHVEKKVFITESKLPVRLFIYLLPQEVVSKRLCEKRAYAKKKGRPQPKDEYCIRQHFNLIITNASESQISIDGAYEIYRLRWQIELIFKTWKSLCAMDKVKTVKQHRLECYIFAKLIVLMMGWRIFWAMNSAYYEKTGAVLSQFKFYKYFYRQLSKISKIIKSGALELETILCSINNLVAYIKLNVKRVEKRNLMLIVETFLCVHKLT